MYNKVMLTGFLTEQSLSFMSVFVLCIKKSAFSIWSLGVQNRGTVCIASNPNT